MNSGMRLIIYTGKGGTGKTVISCSTAIKLAARNYRTLIISSDPAHTLSDAFIQQIGDDSSDVIEVIPNLCALQVDPIIEINRQYGEILSYTASIFSSKGVDETLAYEIAMMPGMTQLFSLLKIEEVIRSKLYDAIVLDMPASGEALRYLYFPKLVGGINKKLMGLIGAFSGFQKIFQAFSGFSLPGKMLHYEQELFERLEFLSNIISDNEVTTMRFARYTRSKRNLRCISKTPPTRGFFPEILESKFLQFRRRGTIGCEDDGSLEKWRSVNPLP